MFEGAPTEWADFDSLPENEDGYKIFGKLKVVFDGTVPESDYFQYGAWIYVSEMGITRYLNDKDDSLFDTQPLEYDLIGWATSISTVGDFSFTVHARPPRGVEVPDFEQMTLSLGLEIATFETMTYSWVLYQNLSEDDQTFYQSSDMQTAILDGSGLTAPESPFSDTGRDFLGWSTSRDGSGTLYQPGDVITDYGECILYAVWDEGTELVFESDPGNGDIRYVG